MSQIQQIPVLSYDSHYMPLATNSEKNKNMTRTEFKNFMRLEKKKEQFNETLFEYSAEHEKTRLAVKDIIKNIAIHNYKIKNLKEMKIEGDLEKVELLIKQTRQQINVQFNLKYQYELDYYKLFKPFKQKNTEFGRKSEMIHMEDELYVDDNDTRNREKEEKEEKEGDKTFLKLFGKLPDELLRVIQSYFTYETRAAILVKTYNPVKMFCALKNKGLEKVITLITEKYAPADKSRKVDPKLYSKMRTLYTLFFNRSINELKVCLKYLFLLFRKFHQDQWCFELYRIIVVCKK